MLIEYCACIWRREERSHKWLFETQDILFHSISLFPSSIALLHSSFHLLSTVVPCLLCQKATFTGGRRKAFVETGKHRGSSCCSAILLRTRNCARAAGDFELYTQTFSMTACLHRLCIFAFTMFSRRWKDSFVSNKM